MVKLRISLCGLVTLMRAVSSLLTRQDLFVKPYIKRTVDPSKTSFTPEEKELILQIHNSYRSLILPTATRMRELLWDDDLEAYSRNHTQACTGAHSSKYMVKKWPNAPDEVWKQMGENLYWSYGGAFSIKEALWMFWEEGKDYEIYSHTCTHKQTCGHFRILVTEANWRVGCSINQCATFSNNPYPTPAMFMSCTYNAMFLEPVRPYQVGDRCDGCNSQWGYSFQSCRHRLCASPNNIYFNRGFDGNTSVVGLQYSDFVAATEATTNPTTPTTPEATTSTITQAETTATITTDEMTTEETIATTVKGRTEATSTVVAMTTLSPGGNNIVNYTETDSDYVNTIGLDKGKGPYVPKSADKATSTKALFWFVYLNSFLLSYHMFANRLVE